MQVRAFIADSAADAVAQIRQELGPDALVLNVRKLPGEGLSRLWQKPRIEVLACLQEQAQTAPPESDSLADLRQELAEIRQRVEVGNAGHEQDRESSQRPPWLAGALSRTSPSADQAASPATWRVAPLLEQSGLLPVYVHRVLDELRAQVGEQPPASLARELELTRAVLASLWRPVKRVPSAQPHVFIGPPGVGKTTALCKWLAQAVLVDDCRACVWRLDGLVANTAESLSVYAEILGVPVERCRPANGAQPLADLVLVDLPGVNWRDATGLEDLGRQLATFPDSPVHLVLNAAYDWPLLLAQGRAFATLPVNDVIFTHLDEEPRWGKLWNFVLGTNFTVSFLSAGQNIPGEFRPATGENILARLFPCK